MASKNAQLSVGCRFRLSTKKTTKHKLKPFQKLCK